MPTERVPAPTAALPFVLTIPASPETGRRATRREVATLDEAVTAYEALRDESGEGASTFAAGEVIGPGAARWRISYNGRVQPKAVRP